MKLVVLFVFPLIIICSGAGRIIGGQDAHVAQFPFMASIRASTGDYTFFCGGALISHQWILTSAQCVEGVKTFTIGLGSNLLSKADPERVTVATSTSYPHPDYNNITLDNDIALIHLRMEVPYSDYIQPMVLPVTPLHNNGGAFAIGWGQTSDDDPELSENLNFARVAFMPNSECKSVFGEYVTDNMVCVDGNFNQGTCIGDSGSPLMATVSGGLIYLNVGVATFLSNNGCESTDPSGYTRTYPYVDWIKSVTGIE